MKCKRIESSNRPISGSITVKPKFPVSESASSGTGQRGKNKHGRNTEDANRKSVKSKKQFQCINNLGNFSEPTRIISRRINSIPIFIQLHPRLGIKRKQVRSKTTINVH